MRYIILLVLLAFIILMKNTNMYYKGPKTDHFNGVTFNNHDGSINDKGLLDVVKWRAISKYQSNWPKFIEIKQNKVLPVRVNGDDILVTFINHATVLIQTQGLNIITDPIFSERVGPSENFGPKRIHEPGVPFDHLPTIDIVLISHNHYDHLNLASVKMICNRDNALVVVGLGTDTLLHKVDKNIKVKTLDWGGFIVANDKVKIHFETAYHWSRRGLFDKNKMLWGSFVLETSNGNIYFAGDTGYSSHFKNIGDKFKEFRLALLPIGAYEPRWFMRNAHMDPEEAVKGMLELKAKHALAIHFDTFELTEEGFGEPQQELKRQLEKYGVSSQDFKVIPIGSSWKV